MSLHIIYKDPLNAQLDDKRQLEITDKFINAGLEVAAIRSIVLEGDFAVQVVLYGNDEDTARKVVTEIAGKTLEDTIYLEYLPDDEDQTEQALKIGD